MTNRFVFLLPVALVAAVTLFLGLRLDESVVRLLYSEGRFVESATVVAYGLAIVALLAASRPEYSFRLHSSVILAILSARELDLHKAFTAESLLKISYYGKPDDPLMTRIIAGLVVLLLLGLVIAYLRHTKRFLKALWQGRAFAFTLAAAILFLPLSKIMDSSPRMVHKFIGYDFPDPLRLWLYLSEESLELLAPLLIILAVVQYNLSTRAKT